MNPLRAFVADLISKKQPWQYQGFGMIRAYLTVAGEDWRLNVWHSGIAVPGVSLIHTHPWDFESWIIAGELTNLIYTDGLLVGENYSYGRIVPGPNGGFSEILGTRFLAPRKTVYGPGESYRQDKKEIHETRPTPGTITLNKRMNRGADEALVFWPHGTNWVDAKPRPATDAECCLVLDAATKRLEEVRSL